MKRIASLTSLRFLFCLMVVISHFDFFSEKWMGNMTFYDLHFYNPGMAVCYFFMLSGFGLTYKYYSTESCAISQQKLTFGQCVGFAINRVKRFYPLYLASMLLVVPLRVYEQLLGGRSLPWILAEHTHKLLIAASLLQAGTGWSEYSHIYNSAAWFVSCIFYLYMLYPLLERLNQRFFVKRPWRSLVLILVARIFARFILEQITERTIFDVANSVTPAIYIFDFLSGMILCNIVKNRMLSPKKQHSLIQDTAYEAAAVFLVLLWWVERNAIVFPRFGGTIKSVVDIVLVLNILYVFSLRKGRITQMLSNNALQRLGDATLYIYLIHYVIRLYAEPVLRELFGESLVVKYAMVAVVLLLTGIGTVIMMRLDNRAGSRKAEVGNS